MSKTIIPLPSIGDKSPELSHFPTRMQAFIFRNWDMVPAKRIALCLGCETEDVCRQAYKMGLSTQKDVSIWLSRGYISIIRANWSLLNYAQLLTLLGWDEERLAMVLKEEDFLKHKLGDMKLDCPAVTYRELTEDEEIQTRRIKDTVHSLFPPNDSEKEPFDFFSDDKFQKIHCSADIAPDGCILTDEWGIDDRTGDNAVAVMAQRFCRNIANNWGIDLRGNQKYIELRYFTESQEEEYHEIEITDSHISIVASDSAGILRGLIYLEDMAKCRNKAVFEIGSCRRMPRFKTRFMYSFCGLYNDALDVDSNEWLPDTLLESYSKIGINGIWIQALLYRLTEFSFDPSLSDGWQMRLDNLKKLVKRAELYGIKIILYINEPRAMPDSFFVKYPTIRGAMRKDLWCMCTSTEAVRRYLTDSLTHICTEVPDIGGFFLISASENLTNCYSWNAEIKCPRCSQRYNWEVISEVNNIIADAVHGVSERIKVIVWNWGWLSDDLMDDESYAKCIKSLRPNTIVMCNREIGLITEFGGIKNPVDDYTLSVTGVSETAKNTWQIAAANGHETCAKLQINNTWECSTIPYLPLFKTVETIMSQIEAEGVSHVMLGWTLGGAPSPAIKIASERFFETVGNLGTESDIYEKLYGEDASAVKKASEIFKQAFSEYPFEFEGVYAGPANGGAANLLYEKPTGLKATMTCFAYDDLDSWRTIYPIRVYKEQFCKMASRWEDGMEYLKSIKDTELIDMAKAAGIQLCSARNQILFVLARDGEDFSGVVEIARSEMKYAAELFRIMQNYPMVGFEAANHYYYTKGMLMEKAVNCMYLIDKYDK